ncbi:MAG: alginate lyase family protein [Clostridia bacterium]|nr:alginate lyase family protein [Clostridia bacterium]
MDKLMTWIRKELPEIDRETAAIYGSHLKELFDSISPESIGADFCHAMTERDYAGAVKACANYYRSKPDVDLSGLLEDEDYDSETAEKAVKGSFREVNVDWTFPEGKIDFLFDPTLVKGPRNHEWLWQFNRHSYWRHMVGAYRETGDEGYVKAFENQLLNWIAQTKAPAEWNAPGSAWRTIECGIRLLGSWPMAFYGFRKSRELSDIALLLMIASMHRQTMHLVAHPTSANWLMMESNGIYTFAALFPELTDSAENRRFAAENLIVELSGQILPDGMQYELSPDYQGVVYNCAANFYVLALNLGYGDEIPESFVELMRGTTRAAVLLSTPGFTQPRTNDTYTIMTDVFTGRAEKLLGNDPSWRYVNSERAEGEPPAGETASAFLPYAGFAVMRSDWGKDAAYLCFDVGPLGMAHMHQDKLNINLYKGSQELIYDDGGGQYEISKARDYGVSGYGHNTVLVDGLAQNRREPRMVTEPIDAGWITNDTFDYAAATYDDTFGPDYTKPATHKREVRFVKPELFLVTDTLSSADGMEHDYEVLFHLDTTRVKPLPGIPNGVISDFGKEYEVAMIPLDGEGEVELRTISAATEPQTQGWYVGRNEATLHEAITVSRRIRGVKEFRFVTLLIPVRAGAPLPTVTRESDGEVAVVVGNKTYRLNLNAGNR